MTQPYSGLSPAEMERLDMLAEEAAEVIKQCSKIKRHGWLAIDHMAEPPVHYNNGEMLENELAELLGLIIHMESKGELDWARICRLGELAMAKKLPYTHHQFDKSKPITYKDFKA